MSTLECLALRAFGEWDSPGVTEKIENKQLEEKGVSAPTAQTADARITSSIQHRDPRL